MHSIEYTREAVKALSKMPRNVREQMVSKIDGLARDPFGAANVKKLVGQPGYRLRVGDWRLIFDRQDAVRVIAIERIKPRGDAYK